MENREGFCWTRFGPESGETFAQILVRKEAERSSNGGVFLWGVGNALWPSLRELLKFSEEPKVVFSPIRSTPKTVDVAPDKIVAWLAARTPSGDRYEIPANSQVISRFTPNKSRFGHYALVCESKTPLKPNEDADLLYFQQMKNFLTGNKLGASQVTAIVFRDENESASGPAYPAVLTVRLVAPYFVRLEDPVVIARPMEGEWNPSNAARLVRDGIGTPTPELESLPLFRSIMENP